jgi:pSer/pThr/pTyr-binding forkhead associated (FHA) protein
MAKLVVLTQGLNGQSHELKGDRTTVGRVEDNTFHLAEPSVSSHHCEILVRGADVVVKDLNSTNGTFINGKQVTTEAVLKPGQILKLGQVELKFEDPERAAQAAAKKTQDKTAGAAGVKFDPTGGKGPAFDKNSPFAKKSDKGTKVFIACAVLIGLAIIGIIVYMVMQIGS